MIFTILVSQISKADCPNAVYLNVGDTVKDCPRIGLSKQFDLQNRKDLLELDYDKKILQEKDLLLGMKEDRVSYLSKQSDLWKSEAQRERDEYDKIKKDTKVDFWYGVLLGAGSILLGAWTVKQVK